MTRGVCLCGTVQYEIAGPFQMMMHCHCSMCRKHHGASFATFVAAPYDSFRWIAGQDAIEHYTSSEQGRRSFCRHCGSVTPTLMRDAGLAIAPAGNLEGDLGITPQFHAFVGSKAPYYEITDTLPQHATMPPEFGGGAGVDRPRVPQRDGVADGSCLCGAVAFEVRNPQRMYHCHCSRCRRARGAAHATNLFVSLDNLTFTRGEELVAQYKVPDARFFTVAFCTRCGSGAPRVSPDRGFASVPAGVLDTSFGTVPTNHIFVGSKAPWFEISDHLPRYHEMPPS